MIERRSLIGKPALNLLARREALHGIGIETLHVDRDSTRPQLSSLILLLPSHPEPMSHSRVKINQMSLIMIKKKRMMRIVVPSDLMESTSSNRICRCHQLHPKGMCLLGSNGLTPVTIVSITVHSSRAGLIASLTRMATFGVQSTGATGMPPS